MVGIFAKGLSLRIVLTLYLVDKGQFANVIKRPDVANIE